MIKIDKYRYEIDELNAVRIWNDENPNEDNVPFFYQPDKPEGTPWADRTEAETWAVNFITELVDAATNENIKE